MQTKAATAQDQAAATACGRTVQEPAPEADKTTEPAAAAAEPDAATTAVADNRLAVTLTTSPSLQAEQLGPLENTRAPAAAAGCELAGDALVPKASPRAAKVPASPGQRTRRAADVGAAAKASSAGKFSGSPIKAAISAPAAGRATGAAATATKKAAARSPGRSLLSAAASKVPSRIPAAPKSPLCRARKAPADARDAPDGRAAPAAAGARSTKPSSHKGPTGREPTGSKSAADALTGDKTSAIAAHQSAAGKTQATMKFAAWFSATGASLQSPGVTMPVRRSPRKTAVPAGAAAAAEAGAAPDQPANAVDVAPAAAVAVSDVTVPTVLTEHHGPKARTGVFLNVGTQNPCDPCCKCPSCIQKQRKQVQQLACYVAVFMSFTHHLLGFHSCCAWCHQASFDVVTCALLYLCRLESCCYETCQALRFCYQQQRRHCWALQIPVCFCR